MGSIAPAATVGGVKQFMLMDQRNPVTGE